MADLKCSICLELYKDPRSLPCLHTFCLECLKWLVVDEEDKSTVKCAKCRENHSVPECGVIDFPQDISILLELMVTKTAEDKTEKLVCGSCTSNDPAVAFCEMCGDLYLCDTCVNCHHRMKILKTHNIITLDELIAYFMKFVSDCPKHVGNQLDLYCRFCDKHVCSLCRHSSNHPFHKVDQLDVVCSEVLSKVDTLIADAKDKVKKIKDAINFTTLVENEITKENERMKREVNMKYDEILAELETYRKKALDELENVFAADKKAVWVGRNGMELLLSEIESCSKFSDRFQSLIDPYPEIIFLSAQLLPQLKIVKNRKVDISEVIHAISGDATFQQPDVLRAISSASETQSVQSLFFYQPKHPFHGTFLFQFVDVSVSKKDSSFSRSHSFELTIKSHIPYLIFEVEKISVTRRSLTGLETGTYSSSKCILKDVESNLQQFEVTYDRITNRTHSATVTFQEINCYRPKSKTVVI